MCGIAGTVHAGGLPAGMEGRMERALQRLHPRGPDGNGTWADGRCALGHARLAIIDLSNGGAQPMAGHGLVIVFNGEIYNHETLRRELQAEGYSFRSSSDTEVLLAGWHRWGEAVLPRLLGMFAFAIWDARASSLTMVRDCFGKKPLVYRHDGRTLSFASDLLALRHLGDGGEELDGEAVKLLFSLRYIPEPWTILAGNRKLPAGCLLRFNARDGGIELARWYDGPRPRRPVYRNREEAIGDLRTAFDHAVVDRLVADVPVGAFLSGGIDSSCVVASLVAQGRSVRTFTVGFAGASDYYEERPAARRLAEFFGVQHTELEIGPDDARCAIEAVFDGCDEPFADSSALPVFLLSRETRRHVTVALSGDGADEVFGGYRKYLGEVHAAHYQMLPQALRRYVVEPLVDALPEGKGGMLEMVRRVRRFTRHAGAAAVQRQAGWNRLLSEVELAELLPGCPAQPNIDDLFANARAEAEQWGADPITTMLHGDIRIGLVGDMLAKVDRMSMANSLEVRSPFLDRRVVECAAAMPGSFKLGSRRGKLIVRDAFADRLPQWLFSLPKKGFEVPIAQWMRHELADSVRWAADPDRLRRQGLIDPAVPARWIAALAQGQRDTSWHIWTLLALQHWLEKNR